MITDSAGAPGGVAAGRLDGGLTRRLPQGERGLTGRRTASASGVVIPAMSGGRVRPCRVAADARPGHWDQAAGP
ncbi:hypothetical protein, partial [Streptomyces sp. NPDC004976]